MEALILTIIRPRLFESSRFHGARIDDARIKRGQRVQGSFLGALRETCTISKRVFERARRKLAVQMGTLALVDKVAV